ncbi:hypothetical protein CAOG_009758 [Capsaspora owczarzaki ATCC 30864]|uniref:Uncharacterized protein n=1 Tax=Capsaspora owczarzaki (strain ATCC 30864) TaxID=595528 RepID=A0A0D2VRK0_CAPO3|nr:hypothetical protein CAOG_009758 [Capsaspora owczarzaki ATCC 30864]
MECSLNQCAPSQVDGSCFVASLHPQLLCLVLELVGNVRVGNNALAHTVRLRHAIDGLRMVSLGGGEPRGDGRGEFGVSSSSIASLLEPLALQLQHVAVANDGVHRARRAGFFEQLGRSGKVLRKVSITAGVGNRQSNLRVGVTAFCSADEPVLCFFRVLWLGTQSNTQAELCARMAAHGSLTEPLDTLALVDGGRTPFSLAFEVGHSSQVLRMTMVLFGCTFGPREGQVTVGNAASAAGIHVAQGRHGGRIAARSSALEENKRGALQLVRIDVFMFAFIVFFLTVRMSMARSMRVSMAFVVIAVRVAMAMRAIGFFVFIMGAVRMAVATLAAVRMSVSALVRVTMTRFILIMATMRMTVPTVATMGMAMTVIIFIITAVRMTVPSVATMRVAMTAVIPVVRMATTHMNTALLVCLLAKEVAKIDSGMDVVLFCSFRPKVLRASFVLKVVIEQPAKDGLRMRQALGGRTLVVLGCNCLGSISFVVGNRAPSVTMTMVAMRTMYVVVPAAVVAVRCLALFLKNGPYWNGNADGLSRRTDGLGFEVGRILIECLCHKILANGRTALGDVLTPINEATGARLLHQLTRRGAHVTRIAAVDKQSQRKQRRAMAARNAPLVSLHSSVILVAAHEVVVQTKQKVGVRVVLRSSMRGIVTHLAVVCCHQRIIARKCAEACCCGCGGLRCKHDVFGHAVREPQVLRLGAQCRDTIARAAEQRQQALTTVLLVKSWRGHFFQQR